ncbi:S-layer homology domain-containing protein [Dysosmobacter sp.]|uniref:S-layer homology domain-containing protein n=1 Tax=Dysosmobacter sp. TaxID=2591382 RepID=UPI002A8AF66C|nr:S-layer homology domain-containing protein [Dysosmobacter sp.]MDY3281254.1 S-layer homology domain-containing protein [Dysosmobacter sp.]
MKGFWSRKLPALVLAMTLMTGLTAPALATDHNYSSKWSTDATYHWHACADAGCTAKSDYEEHDFGGIEVTTEPTCYQTGKGVRTCQVCGYKKTESIAATGKHTAATGWTSSETTHWHACTAASGCTARLSEVKHTFTAGEYVTNGSYHWQVCTVCGGASAKTAHADKDLNGACDACGRDMPVSSVTVTFMNGTSTFATQTVSKGGTPSNPGTPSKTASGKTYTFKGWTTTNPGSSALYNGQTVLTSAKVASTAVSANTTYYAVYTVSYSGSSSDITYSVATGKSVAFDRTDFLDVFQDEYSGYDLRWVEFETDDTLSSSKGAVYYDHDGDDEKMFSSSTIDDYKFYYSSSSYGDYSLRNLSFVAPSGISSRTVELDFTACYSSTRYVTGTLTIEVKGSSSSSSSDGEITYTVKAGKSVDFDLSDFKKVYQEEYSGTPRWVEFETEDTLSSAKGAVYYDYDGDDEKMFTGSSIESYKFYYSSDSYGDYALEDLSFAAPEDAASRTVELECTVYYSSSKYVTATLTIEVTGSDDAEGITYELDPGEEVSFRLSDFKSAYQEEYSGTPRWVEFETDDTLSKSKGAVYFDYDGDDEKMFSASTIDDSKFYYSDESYGDYALEDLSFVAPEDADERTVTLECTIYYSSSRYVETTVTITVGDAKKTDKPDITYEVNPGSQVDFDPADFKKLYQEEYSGTPRWVEFDTDDTLSATRGAVYFDYDGSKEKMFSASTIDDEKFYYDDESYGDYALEKLSFVAPELAMERTVTLKCKVSYSTSKYVEGTVSIVIGASTSAGSSFGADIRYNTTYNTNLQINANDIARFFRKAYPTSTLEYVRLGGVPENGSLYYNYYGASQYGPKKTLLTSSNRTAISFYFSPTSTSQYALTELTYVPGKTNVCDLIPFTAYGSGSKTLSGTILISATLASVADVYGVTPKNTAVTFPASAISNAILAGTGTSLGSIRLLRLPETSVGKVYVGSGTSVKADTETLYTYASGSKSISELRFVPASGFTGSVEIPYVAYNKNGTAIASGKFCLGIVTSLKKFSDINSSTWCYKYVAELSDAGVISGYSDGSFRPDNTVTYGAALKLIMLAAGYDEQKPTGANVFSGYLDKARADGIITRSNVNLSAPITRQQAAQLAAGALKLDTDNLTSIQPFTDTTDASVRALNAAGVVEGYFSNGKSSYKPDNTLTRGQVSAIVWRMKQLDK